MAANKKFTPRASSTLIEEEVTDTENVVETPVEEPVTASPDVTEEVETVPAKAEKSKKAEKVEETPVEEKTEEVTFTATTESKPIERMVKVRLAQKYDGCIGGEWYHFAKDQVVNVPENVKRVLNNTEGMLKPL